jgi:uncharacterized radical SAM protein YgiQ
MHERGWEDLHVVLVTGDAYVDHPSYGAAVIGRVLERAGYRVGIIAQPDWRSLDDFTRLGRPRLFFGITAGNLDSMVANYTTHKRPRTGDEYSPGGRTGLRPDRATIVYANRVREAFGNTAIVLGGLEASLRRFAHYDWWGDEVRRSILIDARADILVYGMGEEQVLEIARRVQKGVDLAGIRGTVVARMEGAPPEGSVELPFYEVVKEDRDKFNQAFRDISFNQDPHRGKTLLQKHDTRYVIQFPPPMPLATADLDALYELPYTRAWHPSYDSLGGVPGFETVKFSLISHRGCCGDCSFCALSMHQGRIVQSRSAESILREATLLTQRGDFKGTITDVGGATANLYKADCPQWHKRGACEKRYCLVPRRCERLTLGLSESIRLYQAMLRLPRVRHVFLESGLRYDLLVDHDAAAYLKEVCRSHVSGRMKVAPEHTADKVLRLMNKPTFPVYEAFAHRFRAVNASLGKDQYLVNYFISAHPGATLQDALNLALHLMKLGIRPEQVQDFIPLPLTLAGCMYHTERHPLTGERLYVAKTFRERKMHRALIQWWNQGNRRYVQEALGILKREDLLHRFINPVEKSGLRKKAGHGR